MIRALALLACLAACARGPDSVPPPAADTLRVATYNVHYIALNGEGDWSVADWETRKEPLDLAVKALQADIVAFQEMESFGRGGDPNVNLAKDWLLARNPDLAAAAVGDARRFPSTQPIFYRTERLRLLDQGWYFFSDTPDVIYSRSFDGSYPAFASWARFEDRRDGTRVHVTNVHTDAFRAENRTGAMDLVARRMAPVIASDDVTILAGDLNGTVGMYPVQRMQDAGLTFAGVTGSTYHFDRGLNLFGAIDHIAYRGARQRGKPVVLRRQFAGEWPTDHYPVLVDLAY